MRKLFKRFASIILIPLAKWYLRKERTYSKGGIRVKIRPGVFHPGLFSSTNFLLAFLSEQNVLDKSLLELGCGSGIISITAAKSGAIVTASDLNTTAVQTVALNAKQNGVNISVKHSDLFDQIDPKVFDWIIINPPYYPQRPQNEEELAWYCGENFEYFQKLFLQIKNYINSSSQIIMVLTLGCDVERIVAIAGSHGFKFELLRKKNVLFDREDLIFGIKLT